MDKQTRLMKGAIYLITSVLIFFMCFIFLRFITRQVLIEHFGLQNNIINFIFFDDLEGTKLDCKNNTNNVDFSKLYPVDSVHQKKNIFFSKIENYSNQVIAIKKKVSAYTEDTLPFYKSILSFNNILKESWCLEKDVIRTGKDNIIFMNNGYLTNTIPLLDKSRIIELADFIKDFKNFLDKEGIPLYYINAPIKVNPLDKKIPNYNLKFENSNENADNLIRLLNEYKINTYDFRKTIKNSDWYDYFYKTDHHWTTETSLWATGKIADLLNKREDFNFNLNLFNSKNYVMLRNKIELGSWGRRAGLKNVYVENYTKILPKFNTNLNLSIPNKGIDISGNYEKTLFDNERYKNILAYRGRDFIEKPDAYGCVRAYNEDLSIIKNKLQPNNTKRILMLQDSFGPYLSSYLALDTSQLDIIHPPVFNGSIRKYIKKHRPDVVIILYYEEEMSKDEFRDYYSFK